MPMPSANGIAMVDRDHASSPSARKSVEELRRQVSKLKAELELERTKLKQVHRDKTNEIKRNHDNSERERQRAIENVTKRLQNEHAVELRRIKDSITREKENELRQIVKFKDEECKALKQQITEEKEKNKRLEDENRKHFVEKSRDDSAEIERRLRNEIDDLKEHKRKAEENYKLKAAADYEKAELIRRLKSEHEREMNELLRESKREVAKEFQQIKTVEKALEEKSHELASKEQLTRKLEAEKVEIRQRKTSNASSVDWTPSSLESPRRSLTSTGTLNFTHDITPETTDSHGRGNKDKERELRKKNAELQGKLDRLEKKCSLLEKQNASKEAGSHKATSIGEEKIKKLKKRNSELVSIARQLEEKAKKLQDEKNTIMKQASGKADNTAEVEHMKKLFAKQRAKDLAEHAKVQMLRDSELENLRKELGTGKSGNQNEKIEELQSIIKQTAKERLLLEKKLASSESFLSSSPLMTSRHGTLDLQEGTYSLEEDKRRLKTEATQLKSAEEVTRLNKMLVEKERQCEKLEQEKEEMHVKCSKLELERERFAAKCTMLHQKNSELGKKVKEMKKLDEELSLLKEDLEQIENEKIAAEEDCKKLREQVEKLLHFKEDFQVSEKERKELEIQHQSSLDKLNEREREIKQLHKIQEESTRAHHLAVTDLENDVRNLQQKCSDVNEKYESASKELEKLCNRQKQGKLHKATQTLDERHSASSSPGNRPVPAKRKSIPDSEPRTPQSRKSSAEGSQSNGDILETAASRIQLLAMSDSEEDLLSGYSDKAASQRKGSSASQRSEADDNEIASLSRRISQAELSDDSTVSRAEDRNYSDTSRDVSVADGDMGDLEDNDLSQYMADRDDSIGPRFAKAGKRGDANIGPRIARLTEPNDASEDSSAPEDQYEGRPHARPRAKRTAKASKESNAMPDDGDDGDDGDEGIDEKYLQSDDGSGNPTEGEHLAVYVARYSYDPEQYSPNDNPDAELAFQAGEYLYVFGDMDEDGFFLGELMDGQRGLLPSNFVEKVADEDEMMMINGEDEAYDSSDEEEAQLAALREQDTMTATQQKPAMEPVMLLKFSGKLHRNLRLNVEHIPDSNLGDIEEEEEDGRSVTEELSREVLLSQDGVTSDDTDLEPIRIPSPKRVSLERQFTRSVLLNWKAADLPADEVKGYGIYVNGDMRMMIKGCNRTKALIEDIDPHKTYRISVRTLTTKGEESQDQEAMLTIGKDASLAPSDIQVSSISPTSAKIEWLPGNSSYSHQIIVNGTPQRTIRPGTYQHTLVNLAPCEHYRVHVRAMKPQLALDDGDKDADDDPLATAVEFDTEAGGLPDPPLDVTLLPSSPGSSPNTIDLSWIPVTISDSGTSNGARVTGYKVYINDHQCAEVTSPTADCVTVVSWMIERAVKRNPTDMLRLYMKTQSLSGESVSSNVIEVPLSSFDFKVNRLIEVHTTGMSLKPNEQSEGSNGSDSGTELEDRNHNVRETTKNEKSDESQVKEKDDTIGAPEPRTRAAPKVWQVEVEDESESDSGDSNKRDYGDSSDEEGAVEMCNVDAEEQEIKETGVQQDDQQFPLSFDDEIKNEIEADNTPEADQQPIENQQDLAENRRMSAISETSDIDMEELNRSLDSAQSLKRDTSGDEGERSGEPAMRPLEYSRSDLEDSSEETPLSVIHEEDEEEDDVTESRGKASRASGTQSLSEGFQSDDDVLDLLDEEPEENQAHGKPLSADNLRRLSQQEIHLGRGAILEEGGEGGEDDQLARYLTSHAPEEEDEFSRTPEEFSPEEQASTPINEFADRSLEGIQIEEGSTEGERNNTYSDAEADQGVVSTPQGASTPLEGHGSVGNELLPPENQLAYQIPEEEYDSTQGGDVNRTYTLENSEVPEDEQEELIRIFIALYDYDPKSMSPNPGAEEEELKFSEGDLIKIYGDKDEDGFYWGECEGQTGFVPFNMVSEVQVEDEDLVNRTASSLVHEPSLPEGEEQYPPEQTQFLEDNGQDQPRAEEEPGDYEDGTEGIHLEEAQDHSMENYDNDQSIELEDPRNSLNYSLEPRKMIALFDYDPRILSPNPDCEVELNFRVGDILYVYGEMDEDGFFTGELNGIRGLVPSNFLEDVQDPVTPPSSNNVSFASQNSSPGASKETTPNGTTHLKEEKDTPKKKKGLLSKGKQMFKKMTKGQSTKK